MDSTGSVHAGIGIILYFEARLIVVQSHISMSDTVLVLGLGNVLMGDEGVGVRSIEYMQEQSFPEQVTLLDGGTGGFHLLSLFKEYDRFIIIDATIGNGDPGGIEVLKPRFASDFPRSLTSHDIGLRDLMQSAELLGELPEIHLVTVNIEDCRTVKIGLSEPLDKQMPEVHRTVMGILKEMGIA